MIDAFIDWLISALIPPAPPDDMIYCPECGGTGFDKYWIPCQHCGTTGYVLKIKENHHT